MAEVIRAGITRNSLYAMRETGQVEQLARGLYRLAEMPSLSQSDLVTVAVKIPQAVIYLISALSFHELTTQISHEVWIAVPRNSEPPRLNYPPVRVSRLNMAAYGTGIETHHSDGVAIRVYSREKSLVDCFSRRNEVGLDIAIPDIRRRYARGLRNLNQIYLPIVDEAWVLNGSVTPPEVIWRRSDGKEWVGNIEVWKLIQSFEGGNL